MNDRIIILEESYRSKGNIKKLADKINSQEHDVINSIPRITTNEMFSNIKTENNFLLAESSKDTINEFKNILELFIENFYFNTQSNYIKIIQKLSSEEIKNENMNKLKNYFDELFNYNTKIKILTVLKEGFYGSNKINLLIKESFKERLGVYNKNYFSGLPVIITQNDYSMQLFNGDSGIILKDKSELLKVIFKKHDQYIILPLDILPSFEISFAITIHKSQGSEYNEVFIVLPNDENNPLLTKEILYTGITRARNKVIIYGKESVLKKTISNKIIRESGINLWE
jgi:exodeoxyribonuclease V alpha subunit